MLPDHCRAAGLAKAERAIHDLTDAAGQLGLAVRVTRQLEALWNAFHPGGPPPYVYYAPPILERHAPPVMRDETAILDRPAALPAPRCGARRNVRAVLNSPEGQAAIRDVMSGEAALRCAARKLNVHPNSLFTAVRRLREERRRQQADEPAETALSFR